MCFEGWSVVVVRVALGSLVLDVGLLVLWALLSLMPQLERWRSRV